MTTTERAILEQHADEMEDAARSYPRGNEYRTNIERKVDALRAALRETREPAADPPTGEAETLTDRQIRVFLGWLSGDFPELHHVEIARFDDALRRFRKASALAAPVPAAPVDLVELVREWREAQTAVRVMDEGGGDLESDAFSAACDRYDAASDALHDYPLPPQEPQS